MSLARGKSKRRWRVPAHKFKFLRSLIQDVGMILDLDNVVE